MFAYLVRRLLYALPVLIGVNLLTFALFFAVNSPDDMARSQLGGKRVEQAAIANWKQQRGYHLPLFWNSTENGLNTVTETVFYQKSIRMFVLDFGRAEDGRNISQTIRERAWPSLAIAIPGFVVGLAVAISSALLLALFRATWFDRWGVLLCLVLMSISTLFYIIGGQVLLSRLWRLVPISGYVPLPDGIRFLILPVIISLLAGYGASTRWYRTFFLEEMDKDYVRLARAKGLSELAVMYFHVLPNTLIPILTGVVVVIPVLFMGSLLLESFFGIPGLGSYTIDAIHAQDFAIVRSMVFIGSVLYIFGLILTDLSYAAVDPRIRLH